MLATIDKAGRLVIPAPIREQLGLQAGARLRVFVDEKLRICLEPDVAGPRVVSQGNRLVVRPAGEGAGLDPAALVDEERERWPG